MLNGLDSLLFGTFLGITSRQVTVAARRRGRDRRARRRRRAAAASSPRSTPTSRAPRGVPVGLLGFGFLLVLGLSVAETSQITGALLVFALLVTPAATAHQLTSRPLLGVALSVAIALAVTWLGLALAYFSIYPVGFYVTSLSFALYVVVRAACSPPQRDAGAGRLMFAHEFMRNALLAGSFVGLACGLVGYFVVLRAQVFAGDALSHVAFTGALAAAVLGLDIRVGLFVATRPRRHRSWACSATAPAPTTSSSARSSPGRSGSACSSSRSSRPKSSAGNGTAGVRVLFGSIFGLSTRRRPDLRRARNRSRASSSLAIARPLLFASLDSAVAAAQGVPVRALGLGFLAVVGLVAARGEPGRRRAAAARPPRGARRAPRTGSRATPTAACVLSAVLALGSVWLGLTLSYVFPTLPPSTMIIAVAVGAYALTLVTTECVGGRRLTAVRKIERLPPSARPQRGGFLPSPRNAARVRMPPFRLCRPIRAVVTPS